MAHFKTTALEITRQCRRRITHFLASLGTSGTFTGVSRRLKQDLRHVECISVATVLGLPRHRGTKNMAAAEFKPAIYDAGLADRNLFVETEDAQDMTRTLARRKGSWWGSPRARMWRPRFGWPPNWPSGARRV